MYIAVGSSYSLLYSCTAVVLGVSGLQAATFHGAGVMESSLPNSDSFVEFSCQSPQVMPQVAHRDRDGTQPMKSEIRNQIVTGTNRSIPDATAVLHTALTMCVRPTGGACAVSGTSV